MPSYRDIPNATPVVCDVSTLAAIHILNGVISEFAIPCSYLVPNEQTGETDTVPIHLTDEGYSNPVVAIDDTPEGFTWSAWIDETDDSIVRVVISAQCPAAVDETIYCDIAVLITRPTESHGDRTDAVFRGRLSIIASPIVGGVPELPLQPVGAGALVSLDTTNFDGLLSATEDDVQSAMDLLDDHDHQLIEHTHDDVPVHTHDFDNTPAGVITMFGGSTAPAEWLICDGAELSRTTHADLFAAIGTTFGNGDGSTTFNIPDMRGMVVVGRNGTDSDFSYVGKEGGAKTHTLTRLELPNDTNFRGADANTAAPSADPGLLMDHSTYGRLALAAGGSTAHNNLQPYLVMNFIIRTT